MGDITAGGLESKGSEKEKVYHAHGTLRSFMTEFKVFHSFSTALALKEKKGIVEC